MDQGKPPGRLQLTLHRSRVLGEWRASFKEGLPRLSYCLHPCDTFDFRESIFAADAMVDGDTG